MYNMEYPFGNFSPSPTSYSYHDEVAALTKPNRQYMHAGPPHQAYPNQHYPYNYNPPVQAPIPTYSYEPGTKKSDRKKENQRQEITDLRITNMVLYLTIFLLIIINIICTITIIVQNRSGSETSATPPNSSPNNTK